MQVRLIIVSGKANKGQINLKLPSVIGRSRDAQLTVAHPMVSRQHCELYEVDGLLMIRDLGSLNGLMVGDQRVSESAVRPGDEFVVGPLTFRAAYEYDGDFDSIPPPVLVDEGGDAVQEDAVEEIAEFEEVDGPTPFVPQVADAPDFATLDADAHEQTPVAADWEAMAADAAAEGDDQWDAAEFESLGDVEEEDVEEIDGFEEVEEFDEDEEDEEPEPTPPPPAPPLEQPVSDHPSAGEPSKEALAGTSAEEEVEEIGEVDEVEEEEVETLDTGIEELEEVEADAVDGPIDAVVGPVEEQPDVNAWEEIQAEAAGQFMGAPSKQEAPKKKGHWPFGRGKKEDEPAADEKPPTDPIPAQKAPVAASPLQKPKRPASAPRAAAPKATEETSQSSKQDDGSQDDGAGGAEGEEAGDLPDFFATLDSDGKQAGPSPSDTDLNDFFKGLE